jgi:Tfp pilus assembly protein PilZ
VTLLIRPPIPRNHARQQLILKVEFDNAAGFRANYLSDLSEGGVRLNTSLEVGKHFILHLSFLGFVEPLHIEAVVQWSLPDAHPEGPASGLAFVDPTPEARGWLNDVLDSSTQVFILPESSRRVVLLETQPFLREIYGQEVRNWSELRDEEPLDLVMLDDAAVWFEEVTCAAATLGIIDVDELPASGLELYQSVRACPMSMELPLIVLGSPAAIQAFSVVSDDLLLCLRKPLRFGLLMNTVRVLAHDPVPTLSFPGGLDSVD